MTETAFAAGAAKVDITPNVGCWLEGIPRAHPSNAIHDPLHARALVLESEGSRFCLVCCDLIGLTIAYALQVRDAIAGALGTTADRVIVACAHNHSGPYTIGLDFPERVDRAYMGELAHKLEDASRAAVSALQPARLGVGRGEETSISQYRRLWTRDGRIVMNWEEFDPRDIAGPAADGDPDLGVVRIVSAEGTPIAVLYNHACHPNSLPGDDLTITSDFPGYASAMIEEQLGGVALFTNGAQGSVDIEGWVDRNLYGVERRGRALAGAVLGVCCQIEPLPEPIIRAARQVVSLPYRKVPAETVAWARQVANRTGAESVTLRDGIPDEWKAANVLHLAGLSEPGIELEMIGLRLGGAVFFTIPGELFTEIGLRIKGLSQPLQLHVIGLANGYVGYIPNAQSSAEGGYATDVATGAYYAENAEDLIRDGAAALLARL